MHHGRHTPPLDELDRIARHAATSPASRHCVGLGGEDLRRVVVTCFSKLRDEALIPGERDHVTIEIVRVEPESTRLLLVACYSRVPGVFKRTL